jgi:hypothetical protein
MKPYTPLHVWALVKVLPQTKTSVVLRRFCRWSDAKNCMDLLRQHQPQDQFSVIFEFIKEEAALPTRS